MAEPSPRILKTGSRNTQLPKNSKLAATPYRNAEQTFPFPPTNQQVKKSSEHNRNAEACRAAFNLLKTYRHFASHLYQCWRKHPPPANANKSRHARSQSAGCCFPLINVPVVATHCQAPFVLIHVSTNLSRCTYAFPFSIPFTRNTPTTTAASPYICTLLCSVTACEGWYSGALMLAR